MRQTGKDTRALAGQLENWRFGVRAIPEAVVTSANTNPPAPDALATPAFGAVTSTSSTALLSERRILRNFVQVGLVAKGLAVVFDLHFSIFESINSGVAALSNIPYPHRVDASGWYVLAVACVVRGFQLWPYRRFRQSVPGGQGVAAPAPVAASRG